MLRNRRSQSSHLIGPSIIFRKQTTLKATNDKSATLNDRIAPGRQRARSDPDDQDRSTGRVTNFANLQINTGCIIAGLPPVRSRGQSCHVRSGRTRKTRGCQRILISDIFVSITRQKNESFISVNIHRKKLFVRIWTPEGGVT